MSRVPYFAEGARWAAHGKARIVDGMYAMGYDPLSDW